MIFQKKSATEFLRLWLTRHLAAQILKMFPSIFRSKKHAITKSFGPPNKNLKKAYLKLRPVHRHVHPMVVRPPLQVLLIVGVVYRMVQFFVYLLQPKTKPFTFQATNSICNLNVRRILGYVQMLLYVEQGIFNKVEPFRFHLLALVEHNRHVLHVFRIIVVDFLKGQFVLLLALLHLLFGLLNPVLHFFHLGGKQNSLRNDYTPLTCAKQANKLLICVYSIDVTQGYN